MIRFNPRGMSEEELINLSKDYPLKSLGCMEPEFYGLGKEIRYNGFYPQSLPLFLSSEHGICLWDYPQNYSLNAKYPYMLVHSKRMQKAWKNYSKVPCFVMQSPFVSYRRRKKINQSPDASGTLAFFAHSTNEIDNSSSINHYINQLKKLPEAFQPVSICMYFIDINKGYHKPFLENSFKVYTAGNWLDPDFMPRFYEILRHFRFSTSNGVGSNTFYSVEMGIPFSRYGEEPQYYNKSDNSFPLGIWDVKNHKQIAKAYSLFEGLHTEINLEQNSFVEEELGIPDGISRTKTVFILYGSFIKWFFSRSSLFYFISQVYSKVPMFIRRRKSIISILKTTLGHCIKG